MTKVATCFRHPLAAQPSLSLGLLLRTRSPLCSTQSKQIKLHEDSLSSAFTMNLNMGIAWGVGDLELDLGLWKFPNFDFAEAERGEEG